MWLTALHLVGRLNHSTKWWEQLYKGINKTDVKPISFSKVVALFQTTHIDLFPFQLNFQTNSYISWHPDPSLICATYFILLVSSTISAKDPARKVSRANYCARKLRVDVSNGVQCSPNKTTKRENFAVSSKKAQAIRLLYKYLLLNICLV